MIFVKEGENEDPVHYCVVGKKQGRKKRGGWWWCGWMDGWMVGLELMMLMMMMMNVDHGNDRRLDTFFLCCLFFKRVVSFPRFPRFEMGFLIL